MCLCAPCVVFVPQQSVKAVCLYRAVKGNSADRDQRIGILEDHFQEVQLPKWTQFVRISIWVAIVVLVLFLFQVGWLTGSAG